jgi:hypothetical protein
MSNRLVILVALGGAVVCVPRLVVAEEVSAAAANSSAKTGGAEPKSSVRPRSRGRSLSARAAARRAERDAAQREREKKERDQWLARLEARGVEPWPENESDETHAAALTKSREMVAEVTSLLPGMQLYETEHFLFVSNIPPQQVVPYAAYLDKMHAWMSQLYGVRAGHKVWLGGKAPIFAFLERDQFDAFEERFFPDARESLRGLANIYGLCHLSQSGEVVIACYRGDNPHDFAQMLVHETSHGFIHRYKTKAQLPNWVDEGMADLIGAEMVPTSQTVKTRELKAAAVLAQQRSLGGMLTSPRIEGWQYGAASSLNRFLLQSNRQSYVRFVEALKEGKKWDEALGDAYGSTPQHLLAQYGRWMGVPDLRP